MLPECFYLSTLTLTYAFIAVILFIQIYHVLGTGTVPGTVAGTVTVPGTSYFEYYLFKVISFIQQTILYNSF